MSILTSWLLKADAARRLGLGNVAAVARYRLALRLGLHPVQWLQRDIGGVRFFRMSKQVADGPLPGQWQEEALYFGWRRERLGEGPPHWHRNWFTGAQATDAHQPWWRLSDFATGAGDIKTIWEASRFDWVLAFAQRAAAGGTADLDRLNAWLADWCDKNPAYRGPNWKCGQEASIRVLHLLLAARLLGQLDDPELDLPQLIEAHLARIYPTLGYAMAQDNNHGTSEAAALFIGGTWLAALGTPAGRRWAAQGRRWLENRAARLIAEDGSFSQYSVNYHRLMLDAYSLVEHWRRFLGLPAFSPRLYDRLAAATRWLYALTQPETGDAPVLGANDGARLIPLVDTDYRDYRPSVQLAMALFLDRRAYGDAVEGMASWNLPLRRLGIPVPAQAAPSPASVQCDAGGYSLLRRGPAFALLRYPSFRFRPSHADALHLDLWLDGVNHLRDAGSYSYNQGDDWLRYFSGTAGHNTIQFDDRDQMPRLSRFLFGDWPRAEEVAPVTETPEAVTAAAGYTDRQGASHHRQVSLSAAGLRVEDRVDGFARRAVLRWRLAPGDWSLDGATVRRRGAAPTLRVTASVPIARMELTQGWESRYYLQREAVPVLEVEITQPGRLVSDYTFGPAAARTP